MSHFLRRGTGTQLVELPPTDAGVPVVVEFERCAPVESLRTDLRMISDSGEELRQVHVSGSIRHRFLTGTEGSPVSRILVECTRQEWLLRLVSPYQVPLLEATAEGQGCNVLRYEGPPAQLSIQRGDWVDVDGWGEGRFDWALRTYADKKPVGGALIGAGPEPELIVVDAHSHWQLQVDPPRTFDRRISGWGTEVIRYTGPRGTAKISCRRPFFNDVVTAVVLGKDLRPSRSATAFGRLTVLPEGEKFGLPAGALLVVDSRWREPWRISVR
ncbi:hypothetical protein GCM10020367_45490 [Streptomyces sannanensis]|uniref:Uncharacterized protein n=1 Tax=Streptomyces sannanensis TaxID=285536 RepID=A0ABP6SGX4_9ACTN